MFWYGFYKRVWTLTADGIDAGTALLVEIGARAYNLLER